MKALRKLHILCEKKNLERKNSCEHEIDEPVVRFARFAINDGLQNSNVNVL